MYRLSCLRGHAGKARTLIVELIFEFEGTLVAGSSLTYVIISSWIVILDRLRDLEPGRCDRTGLRTGSAPYSAIQERQQLFVQPDPVHWRGVCRLLQN